MQEFPPRQQQMRADGGGEVEPEGQEQPSSGAEKRGLADWSDRASAESSALGTRAELAGGEGSKSGTLDTLGASSNCRLFNRHVKG